MSREVSKCVACSFQVCSEKFLGMQRAVYRCVASSSQVCREQFLGVSRAVSRCVMSSFYVCREQFLGVSRSVSRRIARSFQVCREQFVGVSRTVPKCVASSFQVCREQFLGVSRAVSRCVAIILNIRKPIRYLSIAERHNLRLTFEERGRSVQLVCACVTCQLSPQYPIAPEAAWHRNVFATCLCFESTVRGEEGRGNDTEKASCPVIGYLQLIKCRYVRFQSNY